jgi:hypothetical protein
MLGVDQRVEVARTMRITHGWGYKRLATHFGISRDVIRYWLNGPRGKVGRGDPIPSMYPDECVTCGMPCKGETCMCCKSVRCFNRYSGIETLFGRGMTYEEIADALGSNKNRIGADIERMRAIGGWRVPIRQHQRHGCSA